MPSDLRHVKVSDKVAPPLLAITCQECPSISCNQFRNRTLSGARLKFATELRAMVVTRCYCHWLPRRADEVCN
jgi:hypothetical protein